MVEIVIRALGLGVALAMDAFAVSMSNGLKENKMKVAKMIVIALTFAIFQAAMPMIGYLIGHAFINYISKLIPYIALALLGFLGIKMIIDSKKEKKENEDYCELSITYKVLIVQAIATSIDALSSGLAFADYTLIQALISVGIIAIVTFIICFIGIIIGLEIFIKGIL